MADGRGFTVESHLAAERAVVWSHVASPEGVNREFRPLLRMTFPDGVGDLTETWEPGKTLFRSWILLLGILPVEYDDLAFVEVEPSRRFLERSELLSQRMWEHERTIEPRAVGCVLRDRIRFRARIPLLEGVHEPVFRLVFALRHRNLRRKFGRSST